VITALVIATCLVAQPASSAQPELSEQVKQLIQQLDDRELAKREEAEKELVKLGPQVLPLLPTPNNQMPAEMRQRLARISSALEKVESVSTIEGTKVTLSGEMTLVEAMENISKQTGNVMAGHEDVSMKVKTEFQDVPFWMAIDQLLDEGKLATESLGGRPNTLVLNARPEGQANRAGNAFYQGPFRVQALRIVARRDLLVEQTNSMNVVSNISWEPRLNPISFYHPFESVEAVDDQGNAIEVGQKQGGWNATVHPGMTGMDIEIPLALAPRSVSKIATLRGQFQIVIPGEAEEFVFEGNFKGKRIPRAGVTVTVEDIRTPGELQQILLRVRFEEAEGALESHLTWVLDNEAYLLDPQGERIEIAGLESRGQRQNEVSVAYLFAHEGGLKDCKFVYKTPTSIVRQTVNYELKDLPLP